MKEHLRPPGERFDIGGVLRKDRNDLFCQTVFSANVCQGSNHENRGDDAASFRRAGASNGFVEACDQFSGWKAVVKVGDCVGLA